MKIEDAAAARLILERLGVTPQDLIQQRDRATTLTLNALVPRVSDVVPDPTRKLLNPYWNKALRAWPEREAHTITPGDVRWFINHTRETAQVRKSSRGGHSAAEHGYHALRCLYRYGIAERIIHPWDDPTSSIDKPLRLASLRRALDPALVDDIVDVAATTGHDPELDSLLIRFHLETAARRGGGLALRLQDLDTAQSLALLREKGNRSRWQPVSPTLMTALVAHARRRGAEHGNDTVLRYLNGRPVTGRRYDHLWARLGDYIEPVRTQGITAHWLRHTTLTWVERAFGYGVARAYAGHGTASNNRFGITATYVKADLYDVATALATLTRESHPLAATQARALGRVGMATPPAAPTGLDPASTVA
ncbi:tyrosine-type recombinase/integrase [Actinokineospora cianjurensis]|uniref:Phage integrase family protein n=1 Tax=Actinokineospora cianjurensis TaxID=585224 RepID=A0A421B1Y5_9PSEU|nr:site-specific integrase [Actinokineospora cianjurensis]RLK58352.1 phage integrase family protein [Actinokineospora cianjurensis]